MSTALHGKIKHMSEMFLNRVQKSENMKFAKTKELILLLAN